MLLKSATALKLTLPFIIGILLGRLSEPSFVLVLTLWFTLLVALVVLIGYGRFVYQLRRLTTFFIIIIFLISGMLGYSAWSPQNDFNHFSNHYLPGDELYVEIIEYQKSVGRYDKAVLSVTHLLTHDQRQEVSGKLLAYIANEQERLMPGYSFTFQPQLLPIQNSNNPGAFNQASFWKNKAINDLTFIRTDELRDKSYHAGFTSFWYGVRNYFERQLEHYLEGDALALGLALSLGDKHLLSSELRTSFVNAGAMHVLAVSGLHVGILLMLLNGVFYTIPFLRRKNAYLFVSVAVLWCFAFVTGLSPSVFRAVLMFTILAFGQLRGAQFFSLNSLLVSALFLLFINPFYLFDIGFQLSYLAMLGIVFFYQPIRAIFSPKSRVASYLWDGTAIGIAAQIGTIPISLYYFHQFPNYFVFTNLALMGLSVVALSSVMIFFVVHFVPGINMIVAQIVSYVMDAVVWIVSFVDQLPFSVAKGFSLVWFEVLIAYVLIALVWWTGSRRKITSWFAFSCALFVVGTSFQIQRYLTITEQELVIYNHKFPVLSWREQSHVYCFYPEEITKNVSAVHYMMSDYEKITSGELHFYPLSSEEFVTLNLGIEKRIKVTSSRKELKVEVLNHRYKIPYYFSGDFDFDEKWLAIPGKYTRGKGDANTLCTELKAFRVSF
jgi:competence protein ComEC